MADAAGRKGWELKGFHVLIITVTCFAIIIAVNVLMAYKAISTFPGLEVENSYVASQDFEVEKAAQQALGWTLAHGYDLSSKQLRLSFTDRDGNPVMVKSLDVLVGRTTEARDDSRPPFVKEGGSYVATLPLTEGKWMMHVEAHAADGTLFRQRIDLMVRG